MRQGVQRKIDGIDLMTRFVAAPGLVIANDSIESLAGTATWWQWMLFAVALTRVATEVLSSATEAELAAAHIQRTFLAWLRRVLATLSRGITSAQATVAAVCRSIALNRSN